MNGMDFKEESCAEFYAPEQDGVFRTANRVVVKTLELVKDDNVIKRVLRVSGNATTEPRIVTQFQLQSWKMYEKVWTTTQCAD